MSSCYITISYHIISYLMFFNFISSADLISILFYWIRFIILFSIVSHINEWFVSICWSIRPSVCVFICMNKFIVFSSLLFLYSFFTLSFLIFISLSLLSFLMNVFLTRTWTRTRTRTHTYTYIWIYVPSYDSYILLQKSVSQESYSSDSIISYLI